MNYIVSCSYIECHIVNIYGCLAVIDVIHVSIYSLVICDRVVINVKPFVDMWLNWVLLMLDTPLGNKGWNYDWGCFMLRMLYKCTNNLKLWNSEVMSSCKFIHHACMQNVFGVGLNLSDEALHQGVLYWCIANAIARIKSINT